MKVESLPENRNNLLDNNLENGGSNLLDGLNDMGNNKLNKINSEFDIKFNTYLNAENKNFKLNFHFFLVFSWEHFKRFFPVSITYLIYIMINVFNILFVSHSETSKQNKELLFGVTLGMALYFMLGISIGFGISSSLDTFCTNSFGAKLYYLTGCYRNRALVVLTLIYIPLAVVLFFIKDILASLGQNELVAYHAGNFIRGMLPGMVFFYWGDANRRFLMAQGIFVAPILCVTIVSFLHPLWIYLLFNYLDLGSFGSGVSVSITNILNFFMLLIFMSKYSVKDAYFFINKDAFVGYREFFKIAFPSMLMLCLENWNYNIINFLIGYLNDLTQQNTNSYIISFSSIIFMFPFGLSVSAANFIGQLVGDFAPKKTQVAVQMILIFSLIFSFFITILLFVFRNYFPYMYTNDLGEVELWKNVFLIYIWYAFYDIFVNSFAGIFRGLGLQKIITIINFICFYGISIPVMYILTFTMGHGIYGVWISYIITITVLLISYLFTQFKYVNYYQICKDTNNRLSMDSIIISSNSNSNESYSRFSDVNVSSDEETKINR